MARVHASDRSRVIGRYYLDFLIRQVAQDSQQDVFCCEEFGAPVDQVRESSRG